MTWLWILLAFIVGGIFGMVMSAVLLANGADKPICSDDEAEGKINHGQKRRDP